MNKENKIYFLLPTKEYKIYDFASSVLENYGNDEKLYLLGIFAFRFKKGEEYTIKAFDGNTGNAIDLPLESFDNENKMFVVQKGLPKNVEPFFFRKKDTPIFVQTENGKENLYTLDLVDLPHFEDACKTHKFFFVGEGVDPRL